MALSDIKKRVNSVTGVNRLKKNKRSTRIAYNTFRRRSNGGMGG